MAVFMVDLLSEWRSLHLLLSLLVVFHGRLCVVLGPRLGGLLVAFVKRRLAAPPLLCRRPTHANRHRLLYFLADKDDPLGSTPSRQAVFGQFVRHRGSHFGTRNCCGGYLTRVYGLFLRDADEAVRLILFEDFPPFWAFCLRRSIGLICFWPGAVPCMAKIVWEPRNDRPPIRWS